MRWLTAFSLVAVLAAPMAFGQESPPVFRAQVEAVEVDAFVTDALGNPITDLTADDFEVLENGVPQTITSFKSVNIPIEPVEPIGPGAPEPDVQTNTGEDGRLYVIAFDEMHPALALRARHILKSFLDNHFSPTDVAAVVQLGRSGLAASQDFTNNRRLLLEAINHYDGGFAGSGIDPRVHTAQLREVLEFMGTIRGRRKAMILVTRMIMTRSAGGVFDVLDYTGGTSTLLFDDLHRAMSAATRNNVAVYPLDPAGLQPDGGTGEDAFAPDWDAARAARAAHMIRALDMRAFAEATGGLALVNSNSFDTFLSRLVRANSTYYVIGFTPTNDTRDGRYRRLEVRVRRPGTTVRAREGYLAPRGDRPDTTPASDPGRLAPAVADAILLPLFTRGVPMMVTAVPYRGAGRNANVGIAVEIDASHLDLATLGSADRAAVQVALVATDAAGRVRADQQYGIDLDTVTYPRAAANGLRVLGELVLGPGRYLLRVAAGNAAGGEAGSVVYDLEVPDFTRRELLMSGVTMTAESAQDAVTAALQQDVPSQALPGPVTAVRRFDRGDTVTLHTELYDNSRVPRPHPVNVTAMLVTETGTPVVTVIDTRTSGDPASSRHDFVAALRLDVEPGLYVIRVEARVDAADSPPASRDVPIEVR